MSVGLQRDLSPDTSLHAPEKKPPGVGGSNQARLWAN